MDNVRNVGFIGRIAGIFALVCGRIPGRFSDGDIRKNQPARTTIALFELGLGVVGVAVFAVSAYRHGHVALAALDTAVVLILSALLIHVRLTRDTMLASIVGITAMTVLVFTNFLTGGVGGTGLVWSLLVPLYTVFTLGARCGTFISSVYFLAMLGVSLTLKPPLGMEAYSWLALSRVWVLYIFTTAILLVYERVRSRALEQLTLRNRELSDLMDELGRAGDGLRVREEQLDRALRSSRQALWDWDIPADRMTMRPPLFESLIQGRHLMSPSGWGDDRVHPDDRVLVERLRQGIIDGESQSFTCEFRVGDDEGRWRWMRLGGRITAFDHHGVPLSASGMLMDITGSKDGELALETEHQQYLSIFESISEPIYITDPNTHEILFLNRAVRDTWGGEVGDTCHVVMKGSSVPCPGCTNHLVFGENIGKINNSEVYNEKSGRWYSSIEKAIRWPDGRMVHYVMCIDITTRRQAEEKTRRALAEKELLLKEIHHRVKNNMQVISSLLMLQMDRIDDPRHLGVFKESIDRIKTMALIHVMLYESEDFSRIAAGDYFTRIFENLVVAFHDDSGRIGVTFDIDDVHLTPDRAIPVGLVVNELVTNAFRHAFPDGGEGTIAISMKRMPEGVMELRVGDDGVGMGGDDHAGRPPSFGLKVVSLLVEGQLAGTFEHEATPSGTTFVVRFRL